MKHFLTIDGAEIIVHEFGAGPPCLLLHGYPQDHKCWRKVIPKLESKRKIFAPDWFGWGSSEKSLEMSLRYEDEFQRIEKLLDLLGIEKVDLVGHDYGGLLSLAYAAHYQDRIRSLALINTRAHGKIGFWTRHLLNFMVGFAQLQITRALIPNLPLKTIHFLMFKQFVENGSFTTDELHGYLSFLETKQGRQWFAHFYRHFRTTPREELKILAKDFSFPVAVIWGDKDKYFPFEIGLELAKIIPKCNVTRIEGAGHFSPEERPDEVADAIVKLLNS